MKHEHVSRRLKELAGDEPPAEPQAFKPRPPEWLIHRILQTCGGQPGPMLSAWLRRCQVFDDDVAHWRTAQIPRSQP